MSLDVNALVKSVKQAAVEAVDASSPMALCFGTVTSASPLKIQVDQKITLSEEQLILTDNVRDYAVEMSTMVDSSESPHYTEYESGGSSYAEFASHRHQYSGKKKWKVHNALKSGEKVIMLRCNGGQRYIVLDRWEART